MQAMRKRPEKALPRNEEEIAAANARTAGTIDRSRRRLVCLVRLSPSARWQGQSAAALILDGMDQIQLPLACYNPTGMRKRRGSPPAHGI